MSLHRALKANEIATARSSGVEFKLVELRQSKNDTILTLHANPSSFTTAGPQSTDLLGMCQFHRDQCVYFNGDCYVRKVSADFDLASFASAFDGALSALRQAESSLGSCGLYLELPEGYGFFTGRGSKSRRSQVSRGSGDGHSSAHSEEMKKTEDGSFSYTLTWRKSSSEKGWTTHYRPKTPEIQARYAPALKFVGLKVFSECPEFDFEPCFWRFLPCVDTRGGFHDNNAWEAHGYFDATASKFVPGLNTLLEMDALLRPSGMGVLPVVRQTTTAPVNLAQGPHERRPTTKEPANAHAGSPICFISYSHDDDAHLKWVGKLAYDLAQQGVNVVFDRWDLRLGDDLQKYMEQAVVDSEFVLMVCTTKYTEKANSRSGGVGYESGIVSAKIYEGHQPRKFVPVVKSYDGSKVRPTFLGNKMYIDFSDDSDYPSNLTHLLRHLHDKHTDQRPAVGKPPNF